MRYNRTVKNTVYRTFGQNMRSSFLRKIFLHDPASWRTMAHNGAQWRTINFLPKTPGALARRNMRYNHPRAQKSEQRVQAPRQSSGKSRQDFFAKKNGGYWRVLADCGGYWRNESVIFKLIRTLPPKHAL